MIPFHKDSGFILLLTPFPLHPLIIKDKYGETLSTDGLKEDSVIVILGTGITEWLLGGGGHSFHAASHAVAALDDQLSSRAVVARMKVVPETARSLHGELFGDYFRRSLKSEEHISGNKSFFTSSSHIVDNVWVSFIALIFKDDIHFCILLEINTFLLMTLISIH